MKAWLTHLWRLWSGQAMAEQTAYSRGYNRGFMEGLAVGQRTERGVGFIKGYAEGRESTRLIPLDAGNPPLDEDEGEAPCLPH
jgi:hypothetical protein